ncbi:hypothetical protein IGI04_013792 [Brassica rapa subsp. trilocularis]|uniref:Uncharacterized protein n=1 Tax=Brassica rapa subsp. trilocularis TaxID=1813537 RepID=A0ABQ7N9U5_BRACM|nr:hypothetical protein IGI04_013792 [Brassica rapa subsp. trilocularis]
MSSSFLDVRRPVTSALLLRPERGGVRIYINRGGIFSLEHISSSYLLHLILEYSEMANSRSFFSDLKSGKCSFELCCMKDYEELDATVMTIVDCVVNKTREKIESSTDVLKGIIRPVVEGVEEISWPPRDHEAINQMEKEMIQRKKEGQLDEGFLSEVSAQLRQAKEDKDKPRLAAKLQKVLQLYAATVLSKHSYAKRGNEVVKAKHFLETLIRGTMEQVFLRRLTLGKDEVTTDELSAVIKKRIERILIRTEGGSYVMEYLKGIKSRTNEIIKLLQG